LACEDVANEGTIEITIVLGQRMRRLGIRNAQQHHQNRQRLGSDGEIPGRKLCETVGLC
jgi:hypothetical protein